ncbi:tautomerase family protein (plasmid) [Nicoliella spurrieriana]|uniref:Tautomerase family protein n=2 Tax=Nicoliella spurrieriana TaxID=2925830 RepID=A0A976RR09_9LACO|nr:tautomerase family protein [Nicoliella spurrieriana]UQS86199.1 tautomerase family protein [Nicoliella spurrieriana]
MPLMRIDVIKGHDEQYLKDLLEVSYQTMLDTFGIPNGDRYQVLTQHEPFEMNILDSGLGIERSRDVVVFQITTRSRNVSQKRAYYDLLAKGLQEKIGLDPKNLLVSLSTNGDADWSFGYGKAQFVDGPLH